MAVYLDKTKQKEMEVLIYMYLEESQNGEVQNKKTEIIMSNLFSNYFDKLIHGVIRNNNYKFWLYAELDDLFQEGRAAILSSIHKRQWDPKRGSIFNFFSTVVSKNLINFTRKQSRHQFDNIDADIGDVFNDEGIKYNQNFDDILILDEAFKALDIFFSGKPKFQSLTVLLKHYYELNSGKRFIKKKFIAFAKAHNHSPASVNNYFSYIKRLKLKKEIREMLEME